MMTRNLSCTPIYFNNNNNNEAAGNDEAEVEEEEDEDEFDSEADFIQRYLDPKDRSRVIPPEISMKYMESVAFKTTYGSDPVWKKYRRNFKVGLKDPMNDEFHQHTNIYSFFAYRAAGNH